MSLVTNVYRRGSRYYFRKRIPSDLRHLFPSPIYKVSLRTANHLEAKERAVKLAAQLVNFFQGLRMSDNQKQYSPEMIKLLRENHRLKHNKEVFKKHAFKSLEQSETIKNQTSQIADLEMEGIVKDRIIAKKTVSENNPLKEDSVNLFSKRFHEFMEEKKSEITPAFRP